MNQMKKLGGLSSILGMMPGMGIKASDLESAIDEKQMARMEAIVLSMTPAERKNPKLLNASTISSRSENAFSISAGETSILARFSPWILTLS